jgi:hypothetical protein
MFTGLTTATLGKAEAGDLTINTARLVVKDGAAISSGNNILNQVRNQIDTGSGDGGNLTVKASQSVELTGKAAFATSTNSSSNPGILSVTTGQLNLNDGALFAADTFGSNSAGNIEIVTNQLTLQNGSRIGAGTTGSGAGGKIIINTPDNKAELVNIDGISFDGKVRSGIFTTSRGIGQAGDIELFTNKLNVTNSGEISVRSIDRGQAGKLNITADSIFLNNQARLNSSAFFGTGGDIILNVKGNIIMSNDGNPNNATEISSEAFDNANGGDIIFNLSQDSLIVARLLENSDVVATTNGTGTGGRITADSAKGRIFGFREFNIKPTPESDFTAVSALGQDGVVRATAGTVQAQLPQQPVVRDIPQVCPASQGVTTRQAGRSAFSNAGRGGLPPNPSEALESNTPQVPWVTLDSNRENLTAGNTTPSTTSKPEVIEEAQGWVQQPNGKLLLTTQTSTVLPSTCIYQSNQ